MTTMSPGASSVVKDVPVPVTVGLPIVTVTVPVRLVPATTILPGEVGKVSVKFSPLTAPAFGLEIVKVSVEPMVVFVGFGKKFFEKVSVVGSIIFAMRESVVKSLL